MHSEPNKSFFWRKKNYNSIGASGAAGSDVIELIKKDWAMTQSFVLICMKFRQKKAEREKRKNNWVQLIKRLAIDISGYMETVFLSKKFHYMTLVPRYSFFVFLSKRERETRVTSVTGYIAFCLFFQRRKIEIRFRLYQGMEKMWLLKSNSQSQIRRLVWGKTSPGPIQSSSNVKQNRKSIKTKERGKRNHKRKCKTQNKLCKREI